MTQDKNKALMINIDSNTTEDELNRIRKLVKGLGMIDEPNILFKIWDFIGVVVILAISAILLLYWGLASILDKKIIKYLIIGGFIVIINYIILLIGLNFGISLLIITIVNYIFGFILKYILYDKWVFKNKGENGNTKP